MTIWFTSDLHLNHKSLALGLRGFKTIEEHDWTIIANIASLVNKRDKLFVLGDAAWGQAGLKLFAEIPGTKELVLGNHDQIATKEYLKYFNKVTGFRQYKGFWLSHCPIHTQELWRTVRGNIHGHIHKGAETTNIQDSRYINVNIDMNNFHPVSFEEIIRRKNEVLNV